MLQLFGPLQLPLQRKKCSIVSGEIKIRVPLLAPPPPPRHRYHIWKVSFLRQVSLHLMHSTPHHTIVTFHLEGVFSDSLHLIFSLVGVGDLGFPGYFACKVSLIFESIYVVHNCMKSFDSKPSHQY